MKPILMEVVKLPQSNQYLPEPFKMGEKVLYVSGGIDPKEKDYNPMFVKIQRIRSKKIIVDNRSCFAFLSKKK